MNRLFIHQPLFRILSPLFSGCLVYMMILLINNNVQQVMEQFIGEELYVCIGLSYIILEFSRVSLILFSKLKRPRSELWRLVIQVPASIIICIALVTLTLSFYYEYSLGYKPNFTELINFNGIFSVISLIYISFYFSHRFLYETNTRKINIELTIKDRIEDDFKQFKRGINPQLLFDSFESLIATMYENKEKANELIDHLSKVYRYILTSRKQQVVSWYEEIRVAHDLVRLFDLLPFRKIKLNSKKEIKSLIVPGSLLYIIELITRTSIRSQEFELELKLEEIENSIQLSYEPFDRIHVEIAEAELRELRRSYSVYSDQPISVINKMGARSIRFPKLELALEGTNQEMFNPVV